MSISFPESKRPQFFNSLRGSRKPSSSLINGSSGGSGSLPTTGGTLNTLDLEGPRLNKLLRASTKLKIGSAEWPDFVQISLDSALFSGRICTNLRNFNSWLLSENRNKKVLEIQWFLGHGANFLVWIYWKMMFFGWMPYKRFIISFVNSTIVTEFIF